MTKPTRNDARHFPSGVHWPASIAVAAIAMIAAAVESTKCLSQAAPQQQTRTPAAGSADPAAIRKTADLIRPLHSKLREPKPGEWLDLHKEKGQTFDEYVRRQRQPVRDRYQTMYVQPLGEFTAAEKKLLPQTADFLAAFYGMPVQTLKAIPLDNLPEKAQRVHPQWDVPQVLTHYLLDDVLKSRRPNDAVAVLGLTASDLWPGEQWNFVFGQASLTERVGVWSIHRLGEPDKSEEDYRICLRRTLAIAVHETGHMLGIEHCTAYECGMNGSNSLPETDRHPLEFCPECQAKIWWTCGADPHKRYGELLKFAEAHGLEKEAAYWRQALARAPGSITKK
jgi:archaemetzincin